MHGNESMTHVKYGNRRFKIQRKLVSSATAADFEIAAAVSGKKHVLLGFFLVAAGTVVVTVRSNTTALTGAMTMIAGTPLACPVADHNQLETSAGEALNLLLSTTVQVSGWAFYITVDPH